MSQEVLSIKIGVNDEKEVTYNNVPDVERTLFPNITEASSAEVEELSEKVDELESAISSLGEGIPSGGTTGQLLGKKSNTDYDVEWESVHDVPSGGTTGQVLKKKTDTDYDVEWGNDNTGHDVPSGGTTGQVLKKKSNTDYDTEWSAIANDLPSGGTTGQVLKKKTNTDYDVEWGSDNTGHDVPSGGTTGQVLQKKTNTDYDVEWGTPASGSSDVFHVNVARVNNVLTADKTYNEIISAMNNGDIVIATYDGQPFINNHKPSSNSDAIEFTGIYNGVNGQTGTGNQYYIALNGIRIFSDGHILSAINTGSMSNSSVRFNAFNGDMVGVLQLEYEDGSYYVSNPSFIPYEIDKIYDTSYIGPHLLSHTFALSIKTLDEQLHIEKEECFYCTSYERSLTTDDITLVFKNIGATKTVTIVTNTYEYDWSNATITVV